MQRRHFIKLVGGVAVAKAWYESPAYQKAKQHWDGAADTEFFIIDGGSAPLRIVCRTSRTGSLCPFPHLARL
jgi:hypothetical protein